MEKLYQIQTHLTHVEDNLVNWGPLRLTLRQGAILVPGCSGSLYLWHLLGSLGSVGVPGQMIQVVLTSLPMLLAIAPAKIRVGNRYAEAWAIIIFLYVLQPHVYLYQRNGYFRQWQNRQK